MSEKNRPALYIAANLIILNVITLGVMNLRYPLVGHDYTYAIPSFLDTALHYRLNGLAIQWFTPTFAGGAPAFPNPNDIQYSIPSLLSTVFSSWDAMMASTLFYVTPVFLACFYFFQRIL